MPAPVLKPESLVEIVRQAVFLQRTAHPEITFSTVFPRHPPIVSCDARVVGQALINIVKNAIESIEARIVEQPHSVPGHIRVTVADAAERAEVIVEDNGTGLPRQGRDRLTEPYVTTRAKGSGLGLAIVKKIMEDHQGELMLEDGEPSGARVRMVFVSGIRSRDRPAAGAERAELNAVGHGA
jgi:two-component system nitrogen regulation sensor histidine kinase NtrY